MKLTGFVDEAAPDFTGQIKATKKLGWNFLSLRAVDGALFHELNEEKIYAINKTLKEENVEVAELGSGIANWGKKIDSDFDITLGELERTVKYAKILNVKLVRIMSYAQNPWGENQYEEERFRRLNIIVQELKNNGLIAVHENCMNWGGFSAQHTLKLLENVPNLKLVFDTGNPIFQRDKSKPEPHPWQNAWEFFQAVRPHIAHIHIKDAIMRKEEGEPDYTMPGEGDGYIKEIIQDLKNSNYQGFIAIEPHIGKVFHLKDGAIDWDECFKKYISYGRSLESIIELA